MDDSGLAHEPVFDHVLVHQQHKVFERLALQELVFKYLAQLLVGLPVDVFHVLKIARLKLIERAIKFGFFPSYVKTEVVWRF